MEKIKHYFTLIMKILVGNTAKYMLAIIVLIFVLGIGPGMNMNMLEMSILLRARQAREVELERLVRDIVWDSYTIENMTGAQLLGIVYTQPRILIPDLNTPELFSIPFSQDYREIWSDLTRSGGSFESKESAEDAVVAYLQRQMSWGDNPTYSYEFIGENDYFYQFRGATRRTTIAGSGYRVWTSTQRFIAFKDSVVTLNPGARPLNEGRFTIHNTDAESVLNVLDLLLYFHYYRQSGVNKIHREFHEHEYYFQYVFYFAQERYLVGGGTIRSVLDFPLGASLTRTVITIDKASGEAMRAEHRIINSISAERYDVVRSVWRDLH